MSSNSELEFAQIEEESLSNLKLISNSDLSYKYEPIPIISFKKSKLNISPKYENKSEIYTAVFEWDGNDKNVYLTGDFCQWQQFFEMRKYETENKNGEIITKFFLILFLPKGTYQYKFKINSIWKCNSNFPTCSDPDGNINNVINIPSNKIEEGTTDFSTSHMTLQKNDNNINNNNDINNFFFVPKNDYNSLDEFSYKYEYNYNLFSNQNKIVTNNFLKSKENDILNENYSYKKILPVKHEIINHLNINNNTVVQNSSISNNSSCKILKIGCTFRYYKKMATFIYYKPKTINIKEDKN